MTVRSTSNLSNHVAHRCHWRTRLCNRANIWAGIKQSSNSDDDDGLYCVHIHRIVIGPVARRRRRPLIVRKRRRRRHAAKCGPEKPLKHWQSGDALRIPRLSRARLSDAWHSEAEPFPDETASIRAENGGGVMITGLSSDGRSSANSTDTQLTPVQRDAHDLNSQAMRAIIIAIVVGLAYAIPIQQDGDSIQNQLRSLQEQLNALQKQLTAPVSSEKEDVRKFLFNNDWQPQKRMVAWQPMKRNLDERQPLLHAIEARLSEVLRAGERLGVSPEEVLQDLRYRNQLKK